MAARDAAGASGYTLAPSGDRCLAVVFDGDTAQANWRAHVATQALQAARLRGVIEIVPGMVSAALHYSPMRVLDGAGGGDALPYELLARQVARVLDGLAWGERSAAREIELPVCYGGDYGPDLEFVAAQCGLTTDEVVRLHSGTPLTVFMLGFAPGHPYMGTLDARLSIGRRSTPRTAVPPGSVSIANRQSNVYPAQLPGGWHILGRTPLAMFDPQRDPPCLLEAGDRVRFVPIEPAEFSAISRRLR